MVSSPSRRTSRTATSDADSESDSDATASDATGSDAAGSDAGSGVMAVRYGLVRVVGIVRLVVVLDGEARVALRGKAVEDRRVDEVERLAELGVPLVAVGAHAQMPVRVERLVAQRTGLSTCRDDLRRARGELARRRGAQEDPHRVGALVGVVEDDALVELALGGGEQLDDDGLGLGVPTQSHGAHAELGVDRHHQRAQIADAVGRRRHRGAEPAVDLVEQCADPVGQDLDLLLLQHHADDAGLVHGLEVERAVTGLPDGAGDEPVRTPEHVDRSGHHTSSTVVFIIATSPGPSQTRRRRRRSHRPQPRRRRPQPRGAAGAPGPSRCGSRCARTAAPSRSGSR